jgi:Holliday junction resolvase RusA-like endonuclease
LLYLGLPDSAIDIYVNALIKHLDEKDFDDHQKYSRQLAHILKAEGPTQAQRVDFAMTAYFAMMKRNEIYYKATEKDIDYFFKLVATCPAVASWATSNKKQYSWVLNWLQDN